MLYFILSLFVAVSVASAAVKSDLVFGTNGILKFDHWKNDAYPAFNQTAAPTQFISQTYWTSTTSCSGTIDTVKGTGVGICYTDGSVSYINTEAKVSSTQLTFSVDVYNNKDCSNSKAYTFDYGFPTSCMSEGNTGRKYAYSLINSATPWTTFKFPGVVTKSYFAPATCSSTASAAAFTLTSATNCVTTGGTYPNYTYEKWTACANGYITKTEYTGGLTCDNLKQTSSSQVPLTTCVANSQQHDTESQICYSG